MIVVSSLHVAALLLAGLLIAWRSGRLRRGRSVAMAIFAIYLAGVAHFVILPLALPPIALLGTGFVPIETSSFFLPGSAPLIPEQAFRNILLTVPFGFGLPFLRGTKVAGVAVNGALFSLGIEGAQGIADVLSLAHPTRFVDVNDVLFNTAGAVLGYMLLITCSVLYSRAATQAIVGPGRWSHFHRVLLVHGPRRSRLPAGRSVSSQSWTPGKSHQVAPLVPNAAGDVVGLRSRNRWSARRVGAERRFRLWVYAALACAGLLGAAQAQPAPPLAGGDPGVRPVTWLRLPAVGRFSQVGRLSPEMGWIVTDMDVRVSVDGGETWRLIGVPDMVRGAAPASVAFLDERRGWLVAERGAGGFGAWRTDDGALTWSPIPFSFEDVGSTAAYPSISLDGTALARRDSDRYVSTDAGATWDADPCPEDAALEDTRREQRLKRGAGSESALVASRDPGGAVTVAELPEPRDFVGVERRPRVLAHRVMPDATEVAVVGWMGAPESRVAVYRGTDWAKNWTLSGEAELEGLTAESLGGGEVVIFGMQAGDWRNVAVWSSADLGRTWTHALSEPAPPFALSGMRNIGAWLTSRGGWQVVRVSCGGCIHRATPGESEIVIATVDGGRAWQILTPPQ